MHEAREEAEADIARSIGAMEQELADFAACSAHEAQQDSDHLAELQAELATLEGRSVHSPLRNSGT